MDTSQRLDLRDEVAALCNVSSVFSPETMERCHRLGQALTMWAKQKSRVGLVAAQGRPAMQIYICDGWSAKLRTDATVKYGDHVVHRQGHLRHEMLLERGILRYRHPDGADRMHLLFGPPRGLRHGRTAWHVLEASCQFQPMLRAEGHDGWILSVYVQDGHLAARCLELFRARHALFYQYGGDAALSPDAHEDKDIVVGVRCRAHSAHNSICWGLGAFQDESITDDAFIALSSLNNCSESLQKRVDEWLLRVVQFTERTNPPEEVECFWRVLDVGSKLLPFFVAADPIWDGSKLLVSCDVQGDADVFLRLKQIVVFTYRWYTWSKGRWCKAGRAGRFWVRGVALGLDNAVADLAGDPKWHCPLLSGYKRCGASVRMMLTIISMAAVPSEGVQLNLFKDDRLLRTLPAVEAQMNADFGIFQFSAVLSELVFTSMY